MDPTSAPPHPVSVSALVLAGGRSSRFGADKCRVHFAGTPVVQRVVDRVEALRADRRVDDVTVVGTWAPDGVHLELEPVRFLGPLAALAHGLGVVDGDVVLVLAGDHPMLSSALLELLVERAITDPAADAVVPVGPDGPEPLVSCYRRSIRPVALELLDRERRSMRGLLEQLRVEWIGPEQWSRVDADGASFLDIDTRDDLAELERLAGDTPHDAPR